MSHFTRRDFLKGATATAAGVALTGILTGCSSASVGTGNSDPVAPADSASTGTPTKSTKWYDEAYFKKPASITDIKEKFDVDVVVVGAGNGGCIAAVSAADLGAKVAWVEQNAGPIMWAGEIHALNSKVGKEKYGITFTEAEKNEIVNDICRYASYEVDQRLIKLWADNSGRTMDWFSKKMAAKGVSMHVETDMYKSDMYRTNNRGEHCAYKGEWVEMGPKKMGSEVANPIWVEIATEMGVQKFFEHTALQLLQDSSGKVNGIIVQRKKDNAYIQINAAKGVIISTGGYSGNTEMMDALRYRCKDNVVNNLGGAGHNGDGIKMAMWAGAAIDRNHGGGVAFDRAAVDLDHHTGEPYTSGLDDMWWPGSQPWLAVNTHGERFMNEKAPYDSKIHGASKQPKQIWFQIFDSNYWEDVNAFHTTICSRVVAAPGARNSEVLPGVFPCQTKEEFDKAYMEPALKSGKLKKADTLEDLAKQLGLPADALAATVKRYNENAAKGFDADFGKDPGSLRPVAQGPFYGIALGNWLLCTFNGVRINTNIQAINENGDPIQGLYVTGNDSGGFFANTYPQYYGGLAHGRTTCFARLAALHAITGSIYES
ncbi:fumarate reductase/succinate dehydrogenase flavoprotein domain protein [Desulfitobacterium hafniense DCB-2]|uniref:Fumarate reductase/succinate dehydrogenase flavoprotein domain protein n=1 Tax=Desulfitobacterium hafniense (strain DSM 10664 / DCB-2) TaxID=272564 RepID=B8FZT9_DESHD|nr:FAD-binding protein [Desulfitobacterium hafniense]ACL19163.1 fumarate reductase/succinate dehydrogenase flavoprotein domain protein [Desulfitobacterium hafniense DCB-2]